MAEGLKKSRKMKVFAKGQIVIPISLRENTISKLGTRLR